MSAKALEIAKEAWNVACVKDRSDILRLAALIDAALAELRKAAHSAISALEMEGLQDTPEELARELAPWEPESGGGR